MRPNLDVDDLQMREASLWPHLRGKEENQLRRENSFLRNLDGEILKIREMTLIASKVFESGRFTFFRLMLLESDANMEPLQSNLLSLGCDVKKSERSQLGNACMTGMVKSISCNVSLDNPHYCGH